MRTFLLALLVVSGLASPLVAQADPVHVELSVPDAPVAAGSGFDVTVRFSVESPWHVYADDAADTVIPTVVKGGAASDGVSLESVTYPEDAELLSFDFGGPLPETFPVWSHDFEVTARFAVAPGTAPGEASGTVVLDYQTCDDQTCLPPVFGRELPFTFEVVAAAGAQDAGTGATGAGATGAGAPGTNGDGAGGAAGSAAGDGTTGAITPADVGPSTMDHGPVHVTIRGPEGPVAPGGSFDVELSVIVDPPYHLYAPHAEGDIVPTAVTPSSGRADVVPGPVTYPAESQPLVVDYGFGLETYDVIEGAFTIAARFEVAADAVPGPGVATLAMDFMACQERNCLLPVYGAPLSVAFEIAEGGSAGGPATGAGGTGTTTAAAPEAEDVETRIRKAIEAGDLWQVFVLSVLAGFAALLTPCVFPMIPITVSFFTKRAEASGGKGAMKYALAYGFGIIATYTGFGLLLSLATATAAQGFATNPWVNLAIGGLFVYFGLSLLGFYDIKPPAFLSRAAEKGMARGTAGQGFLPVILMGFVFTVTAFTCTAPVVGSLLAYFSQAPDPMIVVLSMLAFSTAFALPFVLLALFPNAMSSLPTAGGWMLTIKATMGFVELIASLKFFSNTDIAWNLELMPRPTMLIATMMLTAALGMYLLGMYRLPHDVPSSGARKLLSLRGVFAMLVVLFTLYLSQGLTGRLLNGWVESYLPPSWYAVPEGQRHGETIEWETDREVAFAAAQARGSNVFIDFTGAFCINCRLVEAAVFSKQEFADELEARGIVPLQLYTDRRDPATGQLAAEDAANQAYMLERFDTVALPFYALMSPDGEILRRMPNPDAGDRTVEHFIGFLEDPRTP